MMTRRTVRAIVTSLAGLCAVAPAFADTLELTTGQRHTGTLVSATAKSVVFDVDGRRTTIDKRRIRAIYFDVTREDTSVADRVARAQSDLRTLASAVSMYQAHTDRLPRRLEHLTQKVKNAQGQVAGPFLVAVPRPPMGWSPYIYTPRPNGTFQVSSKGDGETVVVPSGVK